MEIDHRLSEVVRAVALSSTSARRVGCVLLRKGRVAVSSTNVEGKTHPAQAQLAQRAGQPHRTSLHAEIRTLLKEGAARCDVLIVGRVNKKGELCLAKPCPVCQLAIGQSPYIKNVYYSNKEGCWSELPAGDKV